jgi:6-pyruvoyl-tetrahydropterin synthase
MRCSLTRALAFHATHAYPASAAHGHLYRIDVTVTGTLDPVTQMVMELGALDLILSETIVTRLAGHQLNAVFPVGSPGANSPTCEAIASWCWQSVASRLPPEVRLERVRVAEDETLWADCTGPT